MMGANNPGPDGFTTAFYQVHWDIVGPSITSAILNFLNGGQMPEGINQTTIVLIPKIKHPQDLKHFRPISLCNVIYKICSKVLAYRLRVFFMTSFLRSKALRKKGKTGACAIKLDMAKAYDRVEWNYLQSIMLRLGFAEFCQQHYEMCDFCGFLSKGKWQSLKAL